jgi:O-antigen/teichoic acid export membrane protein
VNPPAVVAVVGEGRTALTNVLFKALSVPVEKACRLLLVVVAAPVLGEAAFGSYQFATAVTTLLALGTDLGLSVWTTRALARDRTRAAAVVGTALRLKLAAGIPYLALVGVAAAVSGPGQTRTAMLLLGAAALANVFVDYFGAIFRGYERLRDEAALNVARALLITAAGLAALRGGHSVGALSAGVLAGMVASALYGVWMVRRNYGLVGRRPRGLAPFDRALARAAAAEAFPLWLATLLSLLYFKGDVVLLRLYRGDAEVGAYSAAYKIFEGLMILPAVVLAATFPPLARAQGQRRRRWEAALVAVLLAMGLVAGAVVYAGSEPIVALVFGAGFARAVPSLRVLALAVPVLFLNFALTHFLIARDLERRNLVFAGLMLVVNVGVNLAIIPRLGGPGAAWATLITELALTACCLAALRWTAGDRAAEAA